jgi:hypothetical protein
MERSGEKGLFVFIGHSDGSQVARAVGWTWWQTRNWNLQYWRAYGGEGEHGKGWDANGRVPLKNFIKK